MSFDTWFNLPFLGLFTLRYLVEGDYYTVGFIAFVYRHWSPLHWSSGSLEVLGLCALCLGFRRCALTFPLLAAVSLLSSRRSEALGLLGAWLAVSLVRAALFLRDLRSFYSLSWGEALGAARADWLGRVCYALREVAPSSPEWGEIDRGVRSERAADGQRVAASGARAGLRLVAARRVLNPIVERRFRRLGAKRGKDGRRLDAEAPKWLFHGTSENRIESIAASGFVRPSIRRLDVGWFGDGVYFSTSAPYASEYVQYGHSFEPGEEFQLLMVKGMLGKSFEVKDMTLLGKECKEGYDSHRVIVQQREGGNKPPPRSWRVWGKVPVLKYLRPYPYADEIVLFNNDQALPFYILKLKFEKSGIL